MPFGRTLIGDRNAKNARRGFGEWIGAVFDQAAFGQEI